MAKNRLTWTKLAESLNMDLRTLKRNCKGIMRNINAVEQVKRGKPLLPKQIELIKKHLGYI